MNSAHHHDHPHHPRSERRPFGPVAPPPLPGKGDPLSLALDGRSGRLVAPFTQTIHSGRAFYFVCPKTHRRRKNVVAFHDWIRAEIDAMDLKSVIGIAPGAA